MELLNGLDGQYIIYGGKLIKLKSTKCSQGWLLNTNGWIEYTFENGMVIVIGDKEGVRTY